MLQEGLLTSAGRKGWRVFVDQTEQSPGAVGEATGGADAAVLLEGDEA
jgi:hypothetical protein